MDHNLSKKFLSFFGIYIYSVFFVCFVGLDSLHFSIKIQTPKDETWTSVVWWFSLLSETVGANISANIS